MFLGTNPKRADMETLRTIKDSTYQDLNIYVSKTQEQKEDLKCRVLKCCSDNEKIKDFSTDNLHDLLFEMNTMEKELTEVMKAARHLIRKELQRRSHG